MDFTNFYDETDLNLFPPKPEPEIRPRRMISISLNFVFYILIYLFVFRGDFRLLAAVLMVLFVHESGHLLMMKRFGYSDKRLFFIPFMNLFLSGEDNQITLKQKLFILLMGPLPGIITGFVLLAAGTNSGNSELISLSWIFLVWNLVNLLPLDALDGAQVSAVLLPRYNYRIQFVATIIVTLIAILVLIFAKNYFIIIIPVFLFFRLQTISRMKELRDELENRGIDCNLGYSELNNKQYWILRKELIQMNKIPITEDQINEFTESIYEGLIRQNMKAVLLNLPYDNLKPQSKIVATAFWILLFLLPLAAIVLILSR